MGLDLKFPDIPPEHRGKVYGTLAGFLWGLFVVLFGWAKAFALLFCVGLGYGIGRYIDSRESVRDWFDRIRDHSG